MSFRPAVLLCAAAGLWLSACEDSSGPALPASAAEAKNLLVAVKWTPAAKTVNPGFDINDDGVIVTNLFAHEEPCQHDDFMQFTADGKWTGDEGPAKCDPEDPQLLSGTWTLTADGDSLIISDDSMPGDELVAKIVGLTSNRLSLTASSDNWPDGATREETFTWKAK